MRNFFIDSIKGKSIIRATGRFPERILNIASTSGIFVFDVRRDGEDSIVFQTGLKGGEKLLLTKLEGLSIEKIESYGIPVFIKKYRKRVLLCLLPLVFIFSSYASNLFIWRVEIEGGDKKLQDEVTDIISPMGVRRGALKKSIDQYEVKRLAILKTDDLSWMWVDIKGSVAKVKLQKRKPRPEMIPINEPGDVISLHSGIIEKMQVYCGVPLLKEGQYIREGEILVTGVFRSENEKIPTYYHHASADVFLRTNEEKSVVIPKKAIRKTPTGNQRSMYSINFKKNNVNFSLNSSISYSEYDKIVKKYTLPFSGISFIKTTYVENSVSTSDTDIQKELSDRRKAFLKTLSEKGMEVLELGEEITENENDITVNFSADCRVKTDKEIPLNKNTQESKGEANGENS